MSEDKLVGEDHRHRALMKLRLELKKDISRAVSIATKCGIWELLRFYYQLRVSRTIAMNLPAQGKSTDAQIAELHLHDEAVKYAIALVAKHGIWGDMDDLQSSYKNFNNNVAQMLVTYACHINSKFDTEALLHIANIKVIGDRDQDAILETDLDKLEPQRAIYLHYGLRIEQFAICSKERFKSVPELVAQVRKDVSGLEEHFAEVFGLSLERYCAGLGELRSMFEVKLQKALENIDPQNTGSIDFDQEETFVSVASAMYFTDSDLDAGVNADFAAYLRAHPFEPGSVSGDELRFHYLTRRPFLVGSGFAVLSPDLCFDSIVDNIRFTLLEDSGSKHAYKAAASGAFLDLIAEAAKLYGYIEVGRDVDLKQGKKKLGDIDLILFNASSNHTILVEGKNHALPLAVYFRSPEAVEDHVIRTQDWEKRVKRRIEHLKSNSPSYKVIGDWEYIIVSRMPEPLAHHTDLLVLCLEEFNQWLAKTPRETHFKDFHHRIYLSNQPNMTMAEMEELRKKGYSLLRVEP
ncbi:hypothetical protein ACI0FN_00593 [Alcaligenes nematophilus]|uniref:hypothetical protein n=1 Tax=Alcaligenes nematophilus TaxID=2994643 RepID=UPI00384D71E9